MRYSERERRKAMKDKKYRTYTDEFKREALELLKSSGKGARQIERDLGITSGMLLKWRDRYQVVAAENQAPKLAVSDREADQREIQRLRRELTEVVEEREILKKVVSIFSRKSA
jgi:transposase